MVIKVTKTALGDELSIEAQDREEAVLLAQAVELGAKTPLQVLKFLELQGYEVEWVKTFNNPQNN